MTTNTVQKKEESIASEMLAAEEAKRKEQLRKDIELAERIQKQSLKDIEVREAKRKQSPNNIKAEIVYEEHPLDVVAKRLVPDSIPKPKHPREKMNPYDTHRGQKWTTYWGRKDEHKALLHKSYIPVEENGEHATREGLYLYKRDVNITKDQMHRSARLSEQRLNTLAGEKDKFGEIAQDVAGSKQDNELTVEKKKLNE